MKLVFLGAGAFGVPSLNALAQEHDVVLVVSQPDRPAGRGKFVTPTPIAARAAELGLTVIKPPDVNAPDVVRHLRSAGADAWIVIAFGQKLSRELVDGVFAINLHGSLLPAYRGAAPIQRAVMEGCDVTGVSVISIAERMDAGLVYATRPRPIGATETSDDVHDALALLGPEVLSRVLKDFAGGRAVGVAQDEALATRARKLSKADGTVDLAALDARRARAWINGLNGWPGCTVLLGGLEVKLLRVGEALHRQGEPGVVGEDGVVGTASGAIEIVELQSAGGRAMLWRDFVRGRPQVIGQRFMPRH